MEELTTSSTGGQKGVKLERFDLIPVGPLTELARHFGRGAQKYEEHQWRRGYEWSKSYAAMLLCGIILFFVNSWRHIPSMTIDTLSARPTKI